MTALSDDESRAKTDRKIVTLGPSHAGAENSLHNVACALPHVRNV